MSGKKKILVTGADGFIGSHLTEMLVKEGHDVRAFTYYNSFGSWGWLDHAEPEVKEALDVFQGDIRDPHGVREAVKGCDAVLHLAALIGIPFSYHSPSTYVETNIIGTLNVLQAVRDTNVPKLVHTSTSEVYGTARFVPITEEHPLQGQSPYSASKIGADQMALSYHRSFGTPVTICRPFNTYGPRQSARAVIPTIITQMLDGAKEIKLGSVHPTRDFNFVKDTARGFIAMMEADGIEGEVVNLGSNFEISILETAHTIADLIGGGIKIDFDKERERPKLSEVERLWADNSRAKALIGWEPAYGGLEGFRQGLRETIGWFSDPVNRAQYKSDRYNI
ncbi:MAG: NAD-dependent dehydratase [Alphaproteobacteria bacterium RIFOXYD12_FULL_60_8]|nr:MAG: NAD-dependent dehydratase [Alphaproteobacteria bacterium RIFOXYD12_FULL_60_8]